MTTSPCKEEDDGHISDLGTITSLEAVYSRLVTCFVAHEGSSVITALDVGRSMLGVGFPWDYAIQVFIRCRLGTGGSISPSLPPDRGLALALAITADPRHSRGSMVCDDTVVTSRCVAPDDTDVETPSVISCSYAVSFMVCSLVFTMGLAVLL